MLSLACAGCGKVLRVKEELSGKKVKCPNCGKPALVPGAEAGGLLPSSAGRMDTNVQVGLQPSTGESS